MKFKELMRRKPKQWGLRGDPYLWDDICEHLKDEEVPKDTSELEEIIKRNFKEITGQSIESSSEIFIERYSHGGMSSGVVSTDFWLNKALPFLVENNLRKQQENCFRNSSFDITTMFEAVNDSIRLSKSNNSIKIEVLSIEWDGPSSPIANWIIYKELPLDCKLNIEINALLRSKHFGYCESCNSYKVIGHMDSKKMCQCCTSLHFGTVY